MVNIKRIFGFAMLAMIIGISSSFSFIHSENIGRSDACGSIWSKKEVAYNTGTSIKSNLYAMQGIEQDHDVNYDNIIPMNPEQNSNIVGSLENNMDRLDLAMQESSEIMRSLKTGSSKYLDMDQAIISDESQMCIDDFEMQKIETDYSGTSNHIGNNVIAGVDITLPATRIISNNYSPKIKLNKPLEINSATMKVVGVLLRHGLEDRALGMIEKELTFSKIN